MQESQPQCDCTKDVPIEHGPYGNEGYCYCGEFVGHNGDWSKHQRRKSD